MKLVLTLTYACASCWAFSSPAWDAGRGRARRGREKSSELGEDCAERRGAHGGGRVTKSVHLDTSKDHRRSAAEYSCGRAEGGRWGHPHDSPAPLSHERCGVGVA